MIQSICPCCKGALRKQAHDVVCTNCAATYPVTDGIISFVGTDSFYEGKFGACAGKSRFKKLAKDIYCKAAVSVDGLRVRHQRLYRGLRPRCGEKINVLDLGCGGGKTSLKPDDSYHVVGVDLSLSSLKNARAVYDEAYRASLLSLPFPDGSFDCICSFDVIGHIPLNDKDRFFAELHRVLRPGGVSFHYIEIDSTRGYNNWAKRYPQLYKKHFIDLEGHIGLESYEDVLKRLRKNGFKLLKRHVLAKFILPPGEFSKRFGNEYLEKSSLVRLVAAIDSLFSSNNATKALLGIMLKPLYLVVEPLVPDEYGGLFYVAFIKQ